MEEATKPAESLLSGKISTPENFYELAQAYEKPKSEKGKEEENTGFNALNEETLKKDFRLTTEPTSKKIRITKGSTTIVINEDGTFQSEESSELKTAQEAVDVLLDLCKKLNIERKNVKLSGEAYDKHKAEHREKFTEKLDAGEVLISSGPTPDARKSDFNLDYFLNKPGVTEAITKAVATKGYAFDKDNKSMTRTWSAVQKRTLKFEQDGTIAAPAIPLHDRFKRTRSTDELAQLKLESMLVNDFIAMARFYVTLYIKGGPEAVPQTLDFRINTEGTTAQKRHLTEISKRVFENLRAQEFQSKPLLDEKGYYPQEFLDRVLFNGAKANLQAVHDSQKRATPDSPDDEPPAKRQNLSMGKSQ
ncbi:MAG: hypothetical protein SFW07_01260 [Gammaproteobacteria bacterium]|nr:hypothetical protein [Gammaproteobacteria bacterium]